VGLVDRGAGHRSVRAAALGGRVGGLVLTYFLVMSTFALAIGLVGGDEAGSTAEFLLGMIPTTLVSPLVGDSVLSTLFVALRVGFAIQALGATSGAFGAIAAVLGGTGVEALKSLARSPRR